MVGKIFLAKIFFTDASSVKLRPIVIIREYRNEDFLFLPLTTNLNWEGILVQQNDLETGTLPKPSRIVIPKFGTIHKSLLVKELGTLKQEIMKKVHSEICQSLNCI